MFPPVSGRLQNLVRFSPENALHPKKATDRASFDRRIIRSFPLPALERRDGPTLTLVQSRGKASLSTEAQALSMSSPVLAIRFPRSTSLPFPAKPISTTFYRGRSRREVQTRRVKTLPSSSPFERLCPPPLLPKTDGGERRSVGERGEVDL